MTILSCCVLEGTFRFCFIQRLVITKHLHFRGVAPFEGLRRLANLARFELLVTEVSQRKGCSLAQYGRSRSLSSHCVSAWSWRNEGENLELLVGRIGREYAGGLVAKVRASLTTSSASLCLRRVKRTLAERHPARLRVTP